MKLAKSLLLASAAGFAAFGAQAADLPSKKAAPVEYVKVCPQYGAGFFVVPGTDTCLRIGGAVIADYQYNETKVRDANKSGTYTNARVTADARTQSDLGLVRTFIQLDMGRANGTRASGSGTRLGMTTPDSSGQYAGAQNQLFISRAFVQVGGLTVGIMPSIYTFGYPVGMIWMEGGDAGAWAAQGIAYTASLGSGLSASVALEDSTNRREAISHLTVANAVAVRNNLPDVTANIRLEQGWGAIQLSGAVHELRSSSSTYATSDSEFGYAGQLGLRVNLPMLSQGSSFTLQGGYSSGASNYTLSNIATATTAGNASNAIGSIAANLGDAVILANGDIEKIDVWTVGGVMNYQATKTVNTYLGASYASVDFNSAKTSTVGTSAAQPYNNHTLWNVGGGATWTPISGLAFTGEVLYSKMDLKVAQTTTNNGNKDSDNIIRTRVRVTRSF